MTRNMNLKLGGFIAFLVVATVLTACAQARKFQFAGSSPAAIWLVVFVLPVGLVAALPLWLIVVGFRRWRGRPAAESA